MSSIRENDLRELGFEPIHIHDFDLGEEPYYYYVWKCKENSFNYLISCVDDEAKNDKWEVFDTNHNYLMKFTKLDDLRSYIDILKRNLVL